MNFGFGWCFVAAPRQLRPLETRTRMSGFYCPGNHMATLDFAAGGKMDRRRSKALQVCNTSDVHVRGYYAGVKSRGRKCQKVSKPRPEP